MGNVPVIHEVGTSFVSLGDAITGRPDKARERWERYIKESVIGSTVASAVEKIHGNDDRAKEYLKGTGRATGKALLLGGFMRDVPAFHELAVYGEILGDLIGGGDTASARKRCVNYVESSMIGGGVCAVVAFIDDDEETAKRLAKGCGKATLKFFATALGVGATVVTGGLAAPLGVAAAAATGAVVQGATGAAACAAGQLIDTGKVKDVGAVVGSGLLGATVGAITEGMAAKKLRDAKSEQNLRQYSKNKTPDKTKPKEHLKENSKSKPQVTNDASKNAVKTKPPATKSHSHMESSSSEADFFPQDPVKPTTPRENSFSFKGGKAVRHSGHKDVWEPVNRKNSLDFEAVKEASRRDIQNKVAGLSNKNRPGSICVVQDTKTGNAFGNASVRTVQQSKFKVTIGSKQQKTLDSIPEETRSVGHGNCAEQVAIHNRRYYSQRPEKLFPKGGKLEIQAYVQSAKGVYTKPVNPCRSCKIVLGKFNQSTAKTLPINSNVMKEMTAAGLIVGCKYCENCREHDD